MKKSFKKAGAAVLSMAMLLSMGAVSMPVYADSDNTYTPGQVAVTIAKDAGTGEKHADDGTHRYEYLDNVDNATVKMYRVALLDSDGWKWDENIETELKAEVDGQSVETDFVKLLERVLQSTEDASLNEDGTWKTVVDDPDKTDGSAVKIDAKELQSLASKLQRLVTAVNSDDDNDNNIPEIARGTVVRNNDGTFSVAKLPGDTELYDEKTKNKIGYYLLITDTTEAGVVIQPVLITLKNTNKAKEQPLSVSLKGTNINIDKSIEKVETRVNTDDEKVITTTSDKTYAEEEAISGTKNTAIVAKDDVITYQIHAELPKYDPKLAAEKIVKPFIITDYADKGINVIGNTTDGAYVQPAATNAVATPPVKNPRIKVYFSEDDALNTSSDIELIEGEDYVIGVNNTNIDETAGGKGFTVTITGSRLRGQTIGTHTENAASALNKANPAVETMEGGHLFVVFDAEVTDDLNRSYTEAAGLQELVADATVTDNVTAEDFEAVVAQVENWKTLSTATPEGGGQSPKAKETAKFSVVTESGAAIKALTAFTDFAGAHNPVINVTNVSDEDAVAYGYYALQLAQARVDAQNEQIKRENAALSIANGNRNVAEMKYGNQYATGDGDGSDEDTTKVFSVDLDLRKVVVENTIVNKTRNDPTRPLYVDKTDATKTTEDILQAARDGGKPYYLTLDGSTYGKTTDSTSDKIVKTAVDTYIADPMPGTVSGTTPLTTNLAAAAKGENDVPYVLVRNNSSDSYSAKLSTAELGANETVVKETVSTYLKAGESPAEGAGTIKEDEAERDGGSYYYLTSTTDGTTTTYGYTTDSADTSIVSNQYVKKTANLSALTSADGTTDEAEAMKDGGTAIYARDDENNQLYAQEDIDGEYTDKEERKPVEGAVFELYHHYDKAFEADQTKTTTDDGNHSLGKAITDSNGKMKMLKQVGEASESASTYKVGETVSETINSTTYERTISYVDSYTEDSKTYYVAYYTTTDDAWTELNIGTYNLKELYVPAGYKKWAAAGVDFEITACADNVTEANPDGDATQDNADYTGEIKGESDADAFLQAAGSTETGTVHFSFANSATKDNVGQLINDVKNEYDDKLPATGGIGTVLFTAGGISIVLIAGALFVMYMKKRNGEEEE